MQFGGVLLEAAPCVAYALVDLDGQVGIVVDISPEVDELVCLGINLACCLYTDYGGGLRHPLVRKHMVSVLASDTVRSNLAHTTMITLHHLPQLLWRLLDNPGIVSVKHAPKRRR